VGVRIASKRGELVAPDGTVGAITRNACRRSRTICCFLDLLTFGHSLFAQRTRLGCRSRRESAARPTPAGGLYLVRKRFVAMGHDTHRKIFNPGCVCNPAYLLAGE